MMLILAVFVLLFLFACSIANFFYQLPNCKTRTKYGIESAVVKMGYFMITVIHELDRRDGDSYQQSTQDGIPSIVVVVLIAYSLTNAVLHLPNSTTAVRDTIDWIVLEMFSLSKLKANIKILTNRIDKLRLNLDALDQDGDQGGIFTDWISRKVDLVEEGVKLRDEAAHIINHWWRGWCGLHNILDKRVEVMISKIDDDAYGDPVEYGAIARDAISCIDSISQTLPAVITDFRHYLHFNTNVETLSHGIQHLQYQLKRTLPDYFHICEAEARKLTTSLEAAKNEAVQVIQEVELMHKYWYKRLPSSGYRLSKRVVEMISHVEKVIEAYWSRVNLLRQDKD